MRKSKYNERAATLHKIEIGKTLLLLEKLNFMVVYVDEFTVNNHTHHYYNWALPGTNPGVPV